LTHGNAAANNDHSPLGGVAAEIVCDRAIARITK